APRPRGSSPHSPPPAPAGDRVHRCLPRRWSSPARRALPRPKGDGRSADRAPPPPRPPRSCPGCLSEKGLLPECPPPCLPPFQVSDRGARGTRHVFLRQRFSRSDRFFPLRHLSGGKEIGLQGRVHFGDMTAQPFQHHARMLHFFVHVVFENGSQLLVVASIGALAIPVNRFQLFHERDHRPMNVRSFRLKFLDPFMQCGTRCCHASSVVLPVMS